MVTFGLNQHPDLFAGQNVILDIPSGYGIIGEANLYLQLDDAYLVDVPAENSNSSVGYTLV